MFVPSLHTAELRIELEIDGWPNAYLFLHHSWYHPEQETFEVYAEAIRNVHVDAFAAILAPALHNGLLVTEMRVTDLTVEDGQQYRYPMLMAGTQAGDRLEPGLAMLVEWHGTTSGRAAHGRTFLPGWREQDSEGRGVPNFAARSAAQAWADRIIADSNTFLVPLLVLSKRLNGQPRLAGLRTAVFTAGTGNRWARQKRRARF